MRGIAIAVVLLCACKPTQSSGPVEYVGGTDPHPGVPVDAAVVAPPGIGEAPPCKPINTLVPLESAMVEIRGNWTEDDTMSALVQFLIGAGQSIELEDRRSRVIVTRPFTGQTIQSTCGINEYRIYALRIGIVDKVVRVGVECQRSMGWEAHVSYGRAIPANRGTIEPCPAPTYITIGDSEIAAGAVHGAQALLNLRAAQRK